ncbi:solute carrier family 52, riboflavin transporter, member 3-A-like [Diadema setosum]|uniref:solute carrier family 52, riboflavin transporter, member 3-A-like n=1 Tax=Diadema setosum TaxID=31175 RepID=UPI003B3B2AAE
MDVDFKERTFHAFMVLSVVLFGSGSWIAINAIWVELPVLVALGIPEGYTLASYLVILIQLANAGPVAFTLASRCVSAKKLEVPVIYASLVAGVVSCLLLVFFWDVTTFWRAIGADRSTALLILSFVLALVNCTSSVTFIPFMVRLKSNYMTLFFVGQGLSALAPSLVALGQGVSNQDCIANSTYTDEISGENCTTWMPVTNQPNFSPEIFFWFLFASMVLSLVAFWCLQELPAAKQEYATQIPETVDDKESAESLRKGDEHVDKQTSTFDLEEEDVVKHEKHSTGEYIVLFVVLAVANALSNSVLPSIQSYSCGAYGLYTYLLAATLGHVANPVGCFVVMYFPMKSLTMVTLTCLFGVLAGAYCMATAALSPVPPLQENVWGSVLVVTAWIIVGGVFAHVKAAIGWILRNEPDNHRLLTWYGIVTQLGSLVGAFIMFPLVSVFFLFVPYYSDPCEDFPVCK